jgi:hypothetical protein
MALEFFSSEPLYLQQELNQITESRLLYRVVAEANYL